MYHAAQLKVVRFNSNIYVAALSVHILYLYASLTLRHLPTQLYIRRN